MNYQVKKAREEGITERQIALQTLTMTKIDLVKAKMQLSRRLFCP